MSDSAQTIITDKVNNTNEEPIDLDNISLESLILLINAERLNHLQEQTSSKFEQLREKQNTVSELHKILKALNKATTDQGELNLNNHPELKPLIDRAHELGVAIDTNKVVYNTLERDRLVENIRMSVDDLNVENDMLLQEISRLTNERYESYQMARSIMRPLHESKSSLARALRGG